MTTLALYLTLALGDTDHDETQRTKTKRKRAYLITPKPEYFMFKTTILNKTTSVVVNVQNAGSYVAEKVPDSSVYKESRRIRKEFSRTPLLAETLQRPPRSDIALLFKT
jgi:hypothetical protein